jgi:hypothetical protein
VKTRLPILCPQLYIGIAMRVTACSRCSVEWNTALQRCQVEIGVEHLPLTPKVPTCPLQDRCQHQVQSQSPCAVRARGLICESALRFAGVADPESHPLAFDAITVVSPEEWEERNKS